MASIDAAMATVQTWMRETRRVVDSLRREVEMLRLERVELQAQLRFATEQANREVMAAAKMKEQLDSVRSLPSLSPEDLEMVEDTSIDALERRLRDDTERSVRGDATERTTFAA
jgi:hypothetical protein